MEARTFIDSIKDHALKSQAVAGVPAAVIIAQACLETGYGKYVPQDKDTGQDSKNLFNIKGAGPAGSVMVWATEYYNGLKTKVKSKFRAYNNYQESFEDHAQLMLTKRYAPCMAVKDDPEKFARKLQECGYATDPNYADKLISIMRKYALLDLKIDQEVRTAGFQSPARVVYAGKEIPAGAIDGKTYVEVRTLAELLKLEVNWDAASKTVTLK